MINPTFLADLVIRLLDELTENCTPQSLHQCWDIPLLKKQMRKKQQKENRHLVHSVVVGGDEDERQDEGQSGRMKGGEGEEKCSSCHLRTLPVREDIQTE